MKEKNWKNKARFHMGLQSPTNIAQNTPITQTAPVALDIPLFHYSFTYFIFSSSEQDILFSYSIILFFNLFVPISFCSSFDVYPFNVSFQKLFFFFQTLPVSVCCLWSIFFFLDLLLLCSSCNFYFSCWLICYLWHRSNQIPGTLLHHSTS